MRHPLHALPGAAVLGAILAALPGPGARAAPLPSARPSAPVQAFDPDLIHRDPDGRVYISIRDSRGILDAMEGGRLGRLQAIRPTLGTSPMLRGLCDAAIARVQGDMARSDAALAGAMRAGGALGDPDRSINPLDLLIETMRVGNLMLEGRTRDWALAQDRMARVYFAPIRQFYRLPDLEFRNMDFVTLTVPAASIPAPSSSGPATDHVAFEPSRILIDGQRPLAAKGTVTLGGTTLPAVFDTGSFTGSIPAPLARQKHLVVIGHVARLGDGSGRKGTADIVLVPTLTVGRTLFANQMMTVSQAGSVIIGLQQLARLPHVTVSAHGIDFGQAAPLACSDRMTLQSQRSGMTMELMFPVSYEAWPTGDAILDTGDNTPEPLTVRMRAFPPRVAAHARSEAVETTQGRYAHAIAIVPRALRIGSLSLTGNVKYEQGDGSMPPAITMGAFRSGTLRFDFATGVACFG